MRIEKARFGQRDRWSETCLLRPAKSISLATMRLRRALGFRCDCLESSLGTGKAFVFAQCVGGRLNHWVDAAAVRERGGSVEALTDAAAEFGRR